MDIYAVTPYSAANSFIHCRGTMARYGQRAAGGKGRTVMRAYDIEIADMPVEVQRKAIKHLYIRVDHGDGRVKVSAPTGMAEQAVHRAVAARKEWIHRQQQRLVSRPSPAGYDIVTGETHYVQGRPCSLKVIERRGRAAVRLTECDMLELRVPPGADSARRRAVLERWYRQTLSEHVPALVQDWQPVMGVSVAEWRIKRMKTRWGTCNIRDRRIWLNLELAKRPPECLEYVLVHEMVHLLERRHNARFHAFMDRFLPDWRERRKRLNNSEAPALRDAC